MPVAAPAAEAEEVQAETSAEEPTAEPVVEEVQAETPAAEPVAEPVVEVKEAQEKMPAAESAAKPVAKAEVQIETPAAEPAAEPVAEAEEVQAETPAAESVAEPVAEEEAAEKAAAVEPDSELTEAFQEVSVIQADGDDASATQEQHTPEQPEQSQKEEPIQVPLYFSKEAPVAQLDEELDEMFGELMLETMRETPEGELDSFLWELEQDAGQPAGVSIPMAHIPLEWTQEQPVESENIDVMAQPQMVTEDVSSEVSSWEDGAADAVIRRAEALYQADAADKEAPQSQEAVSDAGLGIDSPDAQEAIRRAEQLYYAAQEAARRQAEAHMDTDDEADDMRAADMLSQTEESLPAEAEAVSESVQEALVETAVDAQPAQHVCAMEQNAVDVATETDALEKVPIEESETQAAAEEAQIVAENAEPAAVSTDAVQETAEDDTQSILTQQETSDAFADLQPADQQQEPLSDADKDTSDAPYAYDIEVLVADEVPPQEAHRIIEDYERSRGHVVTDLWEQVQKHWDINEPVRVAPQICEDVQQQEDAQREEFIRAQADAIADEWEQQELPQELAEPQEGSDDDFAAQSQALYARIRVAEVPQADLFSAQTDTESMMFDAQDVPQETPYSEDFRMQDEAQAQDDAQISSDMQQDAVQMSSDVQETLHVPETSDADQKTPDVTAWEDVPPQEDAPLVKPQPQEAVQDYADVAQDDTDAQETNVEQEDLPYAGTDTQQEMPNKKAGPRSGAVAALAASIRASQRQVEEEIARISKRFAAISPQADEEETRAIFGRASVEEDLPKMSDEAQDDDTRNVRVNAQETHSESQNDDAEEKQQDDSAILLGAAAGFVRDDDVIELPPAGVSEDESVPVVEGVVYVSSEEAEAFGMPEEDIVRAYGYDKVRTVEPLQDSAEALQDGQTAAEDVLVQDADTGAVRVPDDVQAPQKQTADTPVNQDDVQDETAYMPADDAHSQDDAVHAPVGSDALQDEVLNHASVDEDAGQNAAMYGHDDDWDVQNDADAQDEMHHDADVQAAYNDSDTAHASAEPDFADWTQEDSASTVQQDDLSQDDGYDTVYDEGWYDEETYRDTYIAELDDALAEDAGAENTAKHEDVQEATDGDADRPEQLKAPAWHAHGDQEQLEREIAEQERLIAESRRNREKLDAMAAELDRTIAQNTAAAAEAARRQVARERMERTMRMASVQTQQEAPDQEDYGYDDVQAPLLHRTQGKKPPRHRSKKWRL